MNRHFMVDLETMGTTPGCTIVSVGVIAFNPNADHVDNILLDEGYYAVVSREDCLANFLHEDDATKKWWADQAKKYPRAGEAVDAYRASDPDSTFTLHEMFTDLVGYVGGHCSPSKALIYGNGADFDNPIVAVAARNVGFALPWKWGNRCYRTLKNLEELFGLNYTAPKLTRHGTYHNALDDAKSQALHLWEIVRNIRGQ